MRTVVWAPGAKSAGDEIDLPAGSPSIAEIKNAEIFRGSDGTNAATKVDVTATKVDANTIKLDKATVGLDLLVLRYIAVGEVLQP